ncbi:MAG: hypothetical protein ACYDBY_02245 [Thermoanaerobaculia bacterium]
MMMHARTSDGTPTPAELELDRRTEVFLDEMVSSSVREELPADFASRVMAARPFAPWEVATASFWRVPIAVGLGLLAGSLGLALTPLWSLGPATAVTVWAELLAVAFGSPVATLVAALPLLAEGTERASGAVSPGAVALLGGAAALVAGSLLGALARFRRPALPIARRRS